MLRNKFRNEVDLILSVRVNNSKFKIYRRVLCKLASNQL